MIASHNPQRRQYFESLAQVWQHDRRQSISDLMEQRYWLGESEGIPQPYNLTDNPFWRTPIDLCNSRSTRRVTIQKSTQVGGTITSQGILIALALIDPSPSMMLFPTRDEAKLQRNRMYANMLASEPSIRNLVPPETRWNMSAVDMQTQQVYLAYAGSDQTMRGKPARRVFKNETDVYPSGTSAGDPATVVDERTKRFSEPLIFQESTPVGNNSYIAREFDNSQRNFWYFPCPHCGKFQRPRFFPFKDGPKKGCGGIVGYSDDRGNLVNEDQAMDRAHYVCVNGCRIDREYKNSMMKQGMWVPEGCRVIDGSIDGTPKKGDRHVGFHIWTIMQESMSIGEIAATYINFQMEGKLRQFWQDWLGMRYVSNLRMPTWQKLGEKFSSKCNFVMGQVPSDVWFTTTGNDVQKDEVYSIVWGWGPNRTPSLIDLNIFRIEDFDENFQAVGETMLPADLAAVIKLMDLEQTQYPVVEGSNPLGLSSLGIRMGGIDQNYFLRMQDVHQLVLRFKHPTDPKFDRLRCTRGDNKIRSDLRYRMSKLEHSSRDGKVYEDGMRLWQLNKNFYRDIWDKRFLLQPGESQAMRLPRDILDVPNGQRFLRQLLNEQTSEKYDKQNYRKEEYSIKNRGLRCDFRDASIIAEAIADMVVDMIFGKVTWHPAVWERFLHARNQAAHQAKSEVAPTMQGDNIRSRSSQVSSADVIRR